jgi:hypothetical protein
MISTAGSHQRPLRAEVDPLVVAQPMELPRPGPHPQDSLTQMGNEREAQQSSNSPPPASVRRSHLHQKRFEPRLCSHLPGRGPVPLEKLGHLSPPVPDSQLVGGTLVLGEGRMVRPVVQEQAHHL